MDKILVVAKDPKSFGGISNFYRLFFSKFESKRFSLEWVIIGSRKKDFAKRLKRHGGYIRVLLQDIGYVLGRLIGDRSVKLVHLNPSLLPVPLVRDGLMLLMTRLFGRKVVVLFHGWEPEMSRKLDSNPWLRLLFRLVYNRAGKLVTLATEFRNKLEKWGFNPDNLTTTSTMFDSDMLVDDEEKKNEKPSFIYLSRVSRLKGIFELLEAVKILREKNYDFQLNVYGNEGEPGLMPKLTQLLDEYNISDLVEFKGYIDGKDKYKAYNQAEIFLFPSHHEGFPTVILEAMASRCFILTTRVGALREIISDGDHGKFFNTKDAGDLADKMAWCMDNMEIVNKQRMQNYDYAMNHFEVCKVTDQFEKIYANLVD